MAARFSVVALAASLVAQDPGVTVVRGGYLFDGVADRRVENPGIVIRGGKFAAIGGDLPAGATVIEVGAEQTVLPGFFDLHAHHGMNLFGRGRVDETEYYPRIFLANGVTSVFPAGEMNPDRMRAMRRAIDSGRNAGPRVFSSGPYFGSARPRWNRGWTERDIRDEVDRLAAAGARGFKAKGISAAHLAPLIDQAHRHGLTVTGHLGSGSRGSVNPRDAILMGIDRIEHFLGGDSLPASRSAYASLEKLDPTTEAFARTCDLYVSRGVFFDATLSAYGYYGQRDPEVFTYWRDEREFFTPFTRSKQPSERRVMQQFERIYWVKRNSVKAFFDRGGGHLITLGTDHPSWGEYLSGFAWHREVQCLVASGIPEAAALKIGTINGARALGVGDKLGTIEAGKFADLVVVDGDPLSDITSTRHVVAVVKSGRTFDPDELLRECVGKIGPEDEAGLADWVLRMSRR